MVLPVGVTTCLVYKKAPVSFGGSSGGVEVEITPSVRLVHVDPVTGAATPLVDFIEAIAPADGGVAQIILPHTDQPNFRDSAGNAFTNWHYTARVRLKKQGAQPKHEPLFDFQIPSGQTEVDLSKIPHGVASLPTSAPTAAVTSLAGLTGAVSAVQLAALIPDAPLGPSNGTGDSAWINAATAAGGSFRGTAGETYLIDAPLVARSGTSIDFTGCTLQDTAALGAQMLRNWATTNPTATATDAATTAGSAVITTAVAATMGQTVIVQGSGAAGSPTVGEVVAVGAGTITLNRAAATTGTGYTISVHTRDKNISVIGGSWRATDAVEGGQTKDHLIFFRHVDNLTIDVDSMFSTRGLYGISVGSVTDYRAGIGVMNLKKDGIHVTGPARNGRVTRISGFSHDDCVSLTACDYLYISDVAGDIIGFDYGVVDATTACSHVKVMAGAGCLVDGITGTRVSGSCGQAGAYIGEDQYNPGTTGGRIGTVTTGLVTSTPTDPNWRAVYLSNPDADLIRTTIKRTADIGEAIGTGYFNVGTPSTAVIKRLEIDADITGPAGLWWGGSPYVTVESMVVSGKFTSGSGTRPFILQEFGTIKDLDVSAVTNLTGGHVAKTVGAGTITHLTHRGVCTDQAGIVATVFGPAMTLTLAGRVTGGTRALDAHCPTTLVLAGATLSGLAEEPVYVSGAALTILGHANIVNPGAPSMVLKGGTEAVRVNGAGLPVDLAVVSAPVDGDIAFNINAALSCGTGPAVYKSGGVGAGWKSLYSAATY